MVKIHRIGINKNKMLRRIRMKGILEDDVSWEMIHQKVLKSIINSNEFDSELQRTFVAALLDLFIRVNNGLTFFADYYELSKLDLNLFFKPPIIEMFGKEAYNHLENKFRKE
jgi:hypothetical protein